MMLVRMIAVEFSRGRSLFSILVNNGVLFFEVVYDPFSYEMRGDVLRDALVLTTFYHKPMA